MASQWNHPDRVNGINTSLGKSPGDVGAIQYIACELATGCVDIVSPGLSDRGDNATLIEDLTEPENDRAG